MEETRKSTDALLNMKFSFVSETLRELAYERLTFSIRRSLHRKIGAWYEYTYQDQQQLNAHADTVAYHWEQGNVPDKALRAYFLAALNHDRVENYSQVIETALKARDLLTSTPDMEANDDLQLMLSRIDILLFRANRELLGGTLGEELTTRCRNVNAAIMRLCDNFTFLGNLCAQLTQLGWIMSVHSMSIGKMSTKEQRLLLKQGEANNFDAKSDLAAALRECFHILHPVSLARSQS